jgi:hypothetical protein
LKFLVDNALSPLIAEGVAIRRSQRDSSPRLQHAEGTRSRSFRTRRRTRAAEEDRILISADTDFGTLLALRNEEKPSVNLLRRGPKRPAVQLRLLLRALPVMEGPLSEGSIIVVEERRIRVRRLPLAR